MLQEEGCFSRTLRPAPPMRDAGTVALTPVLSREHDHDDCPVCPHDPGRERCTGAERRGRAAAQAGEVPVGAAVVRGGALVAVAGNRLVLHAMAPAFRGRGLAKYLWTALVDTLFAHGHDEVSSSISAANIAAANLYQSLGFRWRHPVDVYHRWTT